MTDAALVALALVVCTGLSAAEVASAALDEALLDVPLPPAKLSGSACALAEVDAALLEVSMLVSV